MTILLPEAEVGEGSEWAEAEGALTPKTSQNEIPKNPKNGFAKHEVLYSIPYQLGLEGELSCDFT
jgi:hypothetical protein